MMKLYKFRSLASDQAFDRAQKILEDNQFHCSRFINLNDPLEGVFYITMRDSGSENQDIADIYSEKSRYRICSFSRKKAFSNSAMWGYYANAFKGMVVEIKVAKKDVKKIDYVSDIPNIKNLGKTNIVEKILTTKLTRWKHEGEYRFLTQLDGDSHRIGYITAVYFGNPYGNVENKHMIYNDIKDLKKYNKRKDALIQVAHQKGINPILLKLNVVK